MCSNNGLSILEVLNGVGLRKTCPHVGVVQAVTARLCGGSGDDDDTDDDDDE